MNELGKLSQPIHVNKKNIHNFGKPGFNMERHSVQDKGDIDKLAEEHDEQL